MLANYIMIFVCIFGISIILYMLSICTMSTIIKYIEYKRLRIKVSYKNNSHIKSQLAICSVLLYVILMYIIYNVSYLTFVAMINELNLTIGLVIIPISYFITTAVFTGIAGILQLISCMDE